ncbi:MAG: hypothetical protein AAF772_13760, partial [Acidobacteriota bacterium]
GVELQPGSNTIVVRDRPEIVQQIVALLDAFDRPPRPLRFEIHILRAAQDGGELAAGGADAPTIAAPAGSAPRRVTPTMGVPSAFVDRLRGVLRYADYTLLARAALTSSEGERVTYDLGDDYRVAFRLGSVLGERRVRVEDFRITRRPPGAVSANKGRRPSPEELLRTHLNLWIGKPLAFVLSSGDDGAPALLVAISARLDDGAADVAADAVPAPRPKPTPRAGAGGQR